MSRSLDSICPQVVGLEDRVEIVFSDNASTDNTPQIIKDRQKKYPFIKYFRNDENMGPDRNFDRVVDRANGEFVWLFSDDDSLKEGGVRKVLDVIEKNPDIDAIYVNYVGDNQLNLDKDYLCANGNEFFSRTDFRNGLMSNNVVRRSAWKKIDPEKYMGTGWVHIGVLMEAMVKSRGYVIAERYVVQGAVEEVAYRSGKTQDALALVGTNFVSIVKSMSALGYSPEVIKRGVAAIKDGNLLYLPLAKAMGLKVDRYLLKRFYLVYREYPSFWLIDLPLLLVPTSYTKYYTKQSIQRGRRSRGSI